MIAIQSEKIEGVSLAKLRIGAVQFSYKDGCSQEDFFAQMFGFVEEASQQGVNFLVFPELMTTCLLSTKEKEDYRVCRQFAEKFFPQYLAFCQSLVDRFAIHLVAGTTPYFCSKRGKILNRAVMVLSDPEGPRYFFQDKIFLTQDEKNWGWSSGRELRVFKVGELSLVILNGYDCEFPILSELLVEHRPDLLIVPSWTSGLSGLRRVDRAAQARSVEHVSLVVRAASVAAPATEEESGALNGEVMASGRYGQAALHFPGDPFYFQDSVLGAENKAQLIWAEVDFSMLKTKKEKGLFYPGVAEVRLFEGPLV